IPPADITAGPRNIRYSGRGLPVHRPLAALIARILTLRSEKAALLGKAHFADQVLARRMAKSGDRALAFIDDLRARCAAAFARECRELEEFKALETGARPGPPAPWEVGHWAERLR